MTTSFSRREFLKGALAASGLTIIATVTPEGEKLAKAAEAKSSGLKPTAYYEVTPDGVVRVVIPSSEMGQGIYTTLAMIVADELEADWGKIQVVQAPAADAFKNVLLDSQMTVGSAATRGWYVPLRKAGAAGKTMLIEAAAQEWKVPVSECAAEKGTVRHAKSGRSLSYGELAAKAAKLPVPQDPQLKKESELKYIGKAMPRVDGPEKVNGKAIFGYDVDLPDIHYAILARPPAYGAKPDSFDEKAAMAVDGVVKVVPGPHGIAVCAKSYTAALKGRKALNVKWGAGSHPDLDSASIEKALMSGLEQPGANAITTGDPKKALAQAAKVLEATYYVPCVAHATMEPMNFTAHVQQDRCDIWGPTQGQTIAQMVAGQVAGLAPDKVQVHTTLLGCGLGRRAAPDFVVDAVIASKALGKPVKVVWTREEDIQHDLFRSAVAHKIKAGLDSQGNLVAWDHKVSCFSIQKYMGMPIEKGIDMFVLWGLHDAPQSPTKSQIAYGMPNFSVELFLSDLPVPVTPWRSVQNAPNAFATECFMDELAQLAGKDSLAFRLESLKDNPRARRVLETVAKNSDWGKPLPKGRGRGIAQHACFGSYVAQVADVSVKDGKVTVNRVDVAVDCGPVVNPNALEAQIEGAVVLALSTTLREEVKFAKGGVASKNFGDYNIIRMSEVPDIRVHIVNSTDEMGGIGEPGVPPLAPAVTNAVFAATGKRLRKIPLAL